MARLLSVSVGDIAIGSRHRNLAERIHAGDLMASAESGALPLSERAGVCRHLEQLMARKGFVYFFQGDATKLIKIGFSDNLTHRFQHLQRCCPERLIVLGAVQGSTFDERELHRKLKAARVHHEWFRPTKEVLLAIERAKEGGAL